MNQKMLECKHCAREFYTKSHTHCYCNEICRRAANYRKANPRAFKEKCKRIDCEKIASGFIHTVPYCKEHYLNLKKDLKRS
ncbi:hypothetical protein CMI42_00380 [Candidatus Pacearchaeota archaeon]|nr:hypothetical protein [Candidatus Pacearchaeota archaeon]